MNNQSFLVNLGKSLFTKVKKLQLIIYVESSDSNYVNNYKKRYC